MNKVYVLPAGEQWIVDRMANEFNEDNADIIVKTPKKAGIIWILADWRHDWIASNIKLLATKRVVTTVHHIVESKFTQGEQNNFKTRDSITTVYHVFNQRTLDFIRPLTTKPIVLIPYWANDKIWRPTDKKHRLRTKHNLPQNCYLLGSMQRDTEGAGISQGIYLPKLEKGADLLADAIIKYRDRSPRTPIEVVLGGWRRQYIQKRLSDANVKFHYFELPTQEVINELYQTLDLYPVTARCEGGPQSLLECGLLGVPVVSRPVGIAEQVLKPKSIHDDVTQAVPTIPNVDHMKISAGGYQPYRNLFASL